ncbi:hypothetical protein X742_20180 [Mesorhizobium sp. LNHC232B00]|nr:hypothetical protein X742_20180 [Mesorhizobium sp. LNHC232B00]
MEMDRVNGHFGISACVKDIELLGDGGLGLYAYLACRLHIMWMIAMPERLTTALACDLKPSMDRMRRLIRR